MPTTRDYDLIVLGSGPGGQRAAVQAAKLGRKVLIVEKERLGGASLHKGTIPSKALREAALHANASDPNIIQRVLAQTAELITEEENIISAQLKRNGVSNEIGTASFVDSHTIAIKAAGGKTIQATADFFVIATGSRPFRPENIHFDQDGIFDSDTILTLKNKPKVMVILGAGVIGCEYASIFARLGVKVHLVDQRTQLLRGLDPDLLKTIENSFTKNGIQLYLGQKAPVVETSPQGLRISLDQVEIQAEALLYCMGRCSNVEELNISAVNLVSGSRGTLAVNDCYQTSQPHIFAVGDVQGSPALATSAAEQGRIAAASAFQHVCGKFPDSFPFGIYTIPEISYCGKVESELPAESFVVGLSRYSELARGKLLHDSEGLLKLIFDRASERLLGVHIVGTQATELVHIGQVAMSLGAKLEFFVAHVFNYPTLAEAYKVAAYNAFNKLQAHRQHTPHP